MTNIEVTYTNSDDGIHLSCEECGTLPTLGFSPTPAAISEAAAEHLKDPRHAPRLTVQTAVSILDRLGPHGIDGTGDPEDAHSEADDVLLRHVHPDIRDAYARVVARCSWWAHA